MKEWHVIQTKPKKEESVFQLFVRNGFEAFLPKIKTFLHINRKHHFSSLSERISPLFPSYLFVHCNVDNFDELRTVRYTRGVHKIIGSGEKPIPIQENVIETIKKRVGKEGFIEQGVLLKPGEKIVVKRGVLKDLIGILEKPVDDKGRVEVLFKIVHHQMRAKVYCHDLEKI